MMLLFVPLLNSVDVVLSRVHNTCSRVFVQYRAVLSVAGLQLRQHGPHAAFSKSICRCHLVWLLSEGAEQLRLRRWTLLSEPKYTT